MQIVQTPISVSDLNDISEKTYNQLVKAVVDVEKKILVIDAEMHADLEHFLLEQGSLQKNLWGINIHPSNFKNANFIEFDSMINIRPNQNNPSRSVLDPKIQHLIKSLVISLVKD